MDGKLKNYFLNVLRRQALQCQQGGSTTLRSLVGSASCIPSQRMLFEKALGGLCPFFIHHKYGLQLILTIVQDIACPKAII